MARVGEEAWTVSRSGRAGARIPFFFTSTDLLVYLASLDILICYTIPVSSVSRPPCARCDVSLLRLRTRSISDSLSAGRARLRCSVRSNHPVLGNSTGRIHGLGD